jgi:hypothetical protein
MTRHNTDKQQKQQTRKIVLSTCADATVLLPLELPKKCGETLKTKQPTATTNTPPTNPHHWDCAGMAHTPCQTTRKDK